MVLFAFAHWARILWLVPDLSPFNEISRHLPQGTRHPSWHNCTSRCLVPRSCKRIVISWAMADFPPSKVDHAAMRSTRFGWKIGRGPRFNIFSIPLRYAFSGSSPIKSYRVSHNTSSLTLTGKRKTRITFRSLDPSLRSRSRRAYRDQRAGNSSVPASHVASRSSIQTSFSFPSQSSVWLPSSGFNYGYPSLLNLTRF